MLMPECLDRTLPVQGEEGIAAPFISVSDLGGVGGGAAPIGRAGRWLDPLRVAATFTGLESEE